MTREAALEILCRIWGGRPQNDLANSYLDAFVALGMLKLDEPKSVRDRINDAWCRLPQSERGIPGFLHAIDDAGLKIVEQ